MILVLELLESLKRSLNKVSTSAPSIMISLSSLVTISRFLKALKESLLRINVPRDIKLVFISW